MSDHAEPVESDETAPGSSTARKSARTTAKSVLITDALAGVVVRIGGVTIILAVIGILVFLIATVWPLFRAPTVGESPWVGRVPVDGRVHAVEVDEYRLLAAALGDTPEVVCFRPDSAEVVLRVPVPGLEGTKVRCAKRTLRSHEWVLGTEDGRLGLLKVTFPSDFVVGPEAAEIRKEVALGQAATKGAAILLRRPGGNVLRIRAHVEILGVARVGSGPVVTAAYSSHDGSGVAVVAGEDGVVTLWRLGASEGTNGGGGVSLHPLPLKSSERPVPLKPLALLVDEEAREVWVVAKDGAVAVIDASGTEAFVREVRHVGEPGRTRVTAADLLIGGRSILTALDDGHVEVWSRSPLTADLVGKADDPGDGRRLTLLHRVEVASSPARLVVPCGMRRTFYLGHEDGTVTYGFSTNERILARISAFHGPVEAIAAAPRDDGILAVGPGLGYRGFDITAPHPEANYRALFSKIHYEGYPERKHHYESTAASDEAELKFSLVILLFGTIKATFYAMVFALPLALLGALYTSQFMHPRVRAVVKPTVEVMASLPSVVLGFIVGIVLGPALEGIVPGVFAGFFGVFLVGIVAGVVWYAIPNHIRQAVSSSQRLGIAVLLVVGTLVAAIQLTPTIQHVFFSGPANPSGDFRTWLRGEPGTGSGLPLLTLGLFVLGAFLGLMFLPKAFRLFVKGFPSGLRFVPILLLALLPATVLALSAGWIEQLVFGGGFRWWLVGDSETGRGMIFEQKNSLVVGIAMGFAVIPIIYTIAEDALSAIPESLKSAALGCGASPWQTALRVVVPAAVPGLFSATMIGLGRAVGETMIVVMAAGGTAIIDWSAFNGFRTLSANIATELPEAPQGGTLYRILFLAGLLLFALTFVVNTLAEIVRIRFRKKFKQL